MEINKIKLIAMDLDGTLTQHKEKLSIEHREILNKLAKKVNGKRISFNKNLIFHIKILTIHLNTKAKPLPTRDITQGQKYIIAKIRAPIIHAPKIQVDTSASQSKLSFAVEPIGISLPVCLLSTTPRL